MPLLALALVIGTVTNTLLQVSAFMFVLSVMTLALLTLAVAALALALGSAYPRFEVENAAQIPTSFGGLVFMMAAVALVALVIAVEALERLDIPSLVIGFSSECCVFKCLEERLGREQRGRLALMLDWGGGSTATHEATRLGAAGLLGHHGRHRFLVTMTDGMPDDPVELERILKRLEWEGKVKVIGLGIGPGTEEVLRQYRASLHLPGVKQDNSEGEAEGESFCDAFSRLLEDLIRHPERY